MPFEIQNARSNGNESRKTFSPIDASDSVAPFLALLDWRANDDSRGLLLDSESLQEGFEILSYVLAGAVSRRDSAGHETTVRTGGLERLTAAAITEYGESVGEARELHAISIWIRVAPDAQPAPRYQTFEPEQLPEHASRGSRVRVLAGSFDGERAPLDADRSMFIAHVRLEARADVAFRLEPGATTLVYALDGSAQIGPQPIVAGQLANSREPRSYIALAAQASRFEALVLSAVAPRGMVASLCEAVLRALRRRL